MPRLLLVALFVPEDAADQNAYMDRVGAAVRPLKQEGSAGQCNIFDLAAPANRGMLEELSARYELDPELSAPIDRRVHARSSSGDEIVRYERAGKWYLECRDGARERINIDTAARLACRRNTTPIFGVQGGTTFDRRVRQRTSSLDG